MTEARVTQAGTSLVSNQTPDARATQVSAAVVGTGNPEARLTQAAIMVLHRAKKPRSPTKQVPVVTTMTSSRGIAGDLYYRSVAFLMSSRTGARDASKYRRTISGDKRFGPRVIEDPTLFGTAFHMGDPDYFSNMVSRTDLGARAAPDPDAFYFGRGGFTVEAWVRPSKDTCGVLSCYDTDSSERGWALLLRNGRRLTFYGSESNIEADVNIEGPVIPLNTWTHVCVDRDASGKFRMYVNGVMVASLVSGIEIRKSAAHLNVLGYSTAADLGFAGRADDLRLTVGVARYASDTGFDVPTRRVATPQLDPLDHENDPYWDLVSLCFDAETPTPVDRSKRSTPLTPVTEKTTYLTMLYGDTSRFSWNSATPIVAENVDGQFDLSGGLFTIELVAGYNTSAASAATVLAVPDQWRVNVNRNAWLFQVWDGSAWVTVVSEGGLIERYGKVDHVAVVRDRTGVYSLYLNGGLAAQSGGPGLPPVANPNLTIYTGGNVLLTEVRITKGVARWDDAFGLPAHEVNDPLPLQGPAYVPTPTPPAVYPRELVVVNPETRDEPGSEWKAVAGNTPGRYNKYTHVGPVDEAPNKFWFMHFNNTTRTFVTQTLTIPRGYAEDINQGLVDVVCGSLMALAQAVDGSCASFHVRPVTASGARVGWVAGPRLSSGGWHEVEVRTPLPPDTVAVEIAFGVYNKPSSVEVMATSLSARLERRAEPVTYMPGPTYPMVASEWVASQGSLDLRSTDYGLSVLGQKAMTAEYHFPAALPADMHSQIDTGECALTLTWAGVRDVDSSDGGHVWIEFFDGVDTQLGERIRDRYSNLIHDEAGASFSLLAAVPAGARSVRLGVTAIRSHNESSTEYADFYPTGFSWCLTTPQELPAPRPPGPVLTHDPHWGKVRYLLSSRNGVIENLARSVEVKHDVHGTVAVAAGEGPFGDGNSLGINVAGASSAASYIDVDLIGDTIAGAFTVELWLRKTGPDPRSYSGLMTGWGGMGDYYSQPLHMRRNTIHADGPLTIGEWYHVALCRDDLGALSMFVNGERQRMGGAETTAFPAAFNVGRSGTSSSYASWPGYIDEFRLTEGVIRYTEDFVPPASRFPAQGLPGAPGSLNPEVYAQYGAGANLESYGWGLRTGADDKTVLIAILTGCGPTQSAEPTAVTVNGAPATLVHASDPFEAYSGVDATLQLWKFPMPVAGRADILVSWPSSQYRFAGAAWVVDGDIEVIGTAVGDNLSSSSVAVPVEAGGHVFAVGGHSFNSSNYQMVLGDKAIGADDPAHVISLDDTGYTGVDAGLMVLAELHNNATTLHRFMAVSVRKKP
ncbi:LamG domain-containing protein [Nitratireductor sp. OM-1]|uniref:LamG domain-containing protein n=1 Tax=Nitratireductor sp. OM-1 TaxID=1756988 RepID=UPI000DDC7263|nr:LamG domain-containing protein [Nitratireductor sp. OM-1]